MVGFCSNPRPIVILSSGGTKTECILRQCENWSLVEFEVRWWRYWGVLVKLTNSRLRAEVFVLSGFNQRWIASSLTVNIV
jgi:hypothetical protein